MHEYADLRSDTVTRPTAAMRRAMADAEVGDDVLGDDPTVNKLEQMAAQKVGKEAALFVPSGSMANSVAIGVHAAQGDEVLLDWDAHSLCYEVGAPAALWGVQTRQFRSNRGVPDVDDVASALRTRSLHSPGTALVVLENTHNRGGGSIIPLDVHRQLYKLVQDMGIRLHIDGARIFNASVATGTSASAYADQADSISFCLSKGLGCPVGSLVCGTRDFVDKARRVRKMLGGGMRQAGVIAAAGIVALETMIDRLADDHRNAKRLAEGLTDVPGVRVDARAVQTNMVYLDTAAPAAELVGRLKEKRVLCLPTAPSRIRLVTHLDVDQEDVERAIEVFRCVS